MDLCGLGWVLSSEIQGGLREDLKRRASHESAQAHHAAVWYVHNYLERNRTNLESTILFGYNRIK
jgi:hypothetical protein